MAEARFGAIPAPVAPSQKPPELPAMADVPPVNFVINVTESRRLSATRITRIDECDPWLSVDPDP
jgi:hypothetical protein